MIDFTAQMSAGRDRALARRNAGVGTNMPVYATVRAQAIAQGEAHRDPIARRGIEARAAFRLHFEMVKHDIDCRQNQAAYAAFADGFF